MNNPQYAIRLLNPIMIAYDKNLFYSQSKTYFEIPSSKLQNSNEWGFANKLYLNTDKINVFP